MDRILIVEDQFFKIIKTLKKVIKWNPYSVEPVEAYMNIMGK